MKKLLTITFRMPKKDVAAFKKKFGKMKGKRTEILRSAVQEAIKGQ